MSFIDIYANEDLGWRKRIDIKDNGTPILDPARPNEPAVIKGSVDFSRRLIRNAKGEQVVSEACVMTSTKVKEGDVLVIDDREWPVQVSRPVKGLLGKELHREVYL